MGAGDPPPAAVSDRSSRRSYQAGPALAWHNGLVARRQVGSNQHQQRWGPDLPAPQRDLEAGDPPERARCGGMWGTRCRAWVQPPTWTHGGGHGERARWQSAGNPQCSPQVLELLAGDPNWTVRQRVVQNPGCPLPLLQQLARDPDRFVRRAAARHPLAPERLLAALAGDPEAWVRAGVASLRRCPQPIFQHLARDPSPAVRRRVASNPACPPPLLARLAHDPDPEVRQAAANNPACPPQHRMLSQL